MNKTYKRLLDLVVNEGSGGAANLARKGKGNTLRAAIRGEVGGTKENKTDPDKMSHSDRSEETYFLRQKMKKVLGRADPQPSARKRVRQWPHEPNQG